MENVEAIKERMLQEGFTIIHEYDDPANEFFPEHEHPTDQFVVVVKGSITITMNNETTTLKPGDEMAFPAKVIHSAKVGHEGCFYIDGERPLT